MSRLLPSADVGRLILTVRNQRVILDADLAALYGVSTKALNQALKRNADRFPVSFVFRLTAEEKQEVVTNCDHLARLKFSYVLPLAFTEYGALMAANVLNSPRAVKMSLALIEEFIRMRDQLAMHQTSSRRLAEIEKVLVTHDVALRDIYAKLRPLLMPPEPPRKRIAGFGPPDSA